MSSSSKSIASCHIRSISLPCRSHHTTFEIEEELRKLKTWETSAAPTAESISNGLCRLVELYKSIDELLNLPLTLQTLSKHQHEKWVDELFEGSVKPLDVCGITRDIASQVKEHVRDLQSSLRRRKGESSIEANITKHASYGKKMKKDAKRLIASLKKMDQKIDASIIDVDQHVSILIRVLREVNAISITIFQSVLVFLSTSKAKPNRWSISRLMRKGTVACVEQEDKPNELENINNSLSKLCNGSTEAKTFRFVQNRLENLEVRFDGIETALECMFRCLIKSRTSLLNLVSCC